jgi:sec-independent protein translocase protein TatB
VFQGSEIFVILLVALVVLGPERLPTLARKLGGYTAELRKAARELRAGLESELGDVSGIVDDVRSPINELKQAARETTGEMRRIGSEAKQDFDEAAGEARSPSSWVGPKPISGPTPADAMADLESIERTGRPVDEVAEEPQNPSWVGPKPISGPTPADAMADLESIEAPGPPLDEAPDPAAEDDVPGEATG